MRLSFNDKESFEEAVESLRFNNPPSVPNSLQQMGSSSSMPLEDSELNEDNMILSDPITLRRVGSSSSLSIQETRTRRSGDIQGCFKFNDPSRNPEFIGTSSDGM